MSGTLRVDRWYFGLHRVVVENTLMGNPFTRSLSPNHTNSMTSPASPVHFRRWHNSAVSVPVAAYIATVLSKTAVKSWGVPERPVRWNGNRLTLHDAVVSLPTGVLTATPVYVAATKITGPFTSRPRRIRYPTARPYPPRNSGRYRTPLLKARETSRTVVRFAGEFATDLVWVGPAVARGVPVWSEPERQRRAGTLGSEPTTHSGCSV